jgi:tetratricopeptide (TPR) repeat protein
MEAVLAAAAPSENTQKIKVALARMYASEGNQVAARKLVEEVLAEDPGDLDAMKMKSGSLILNDQVSEAIQVLRRAVDENPRDPELLTLMAQAHERDGNIELMRDMLALAVEASGGAPNESLRYAQALAATGELLTAEPVLIDALRLSPGNVSLLIPLGELYVSIKDWPRAEAVAAELESMDDPALLDAVTGLRAAILEGQQSTDQAIGYLQGLVDEGAAGLSAKVAIVRAHLADGDNRAALAYAQKIAEADPQDASLRFILASVQVVNGQNDAAEQTFRSLLAEDPARTQVWMALYRSIASAGTRPDEARKVLDDALAANPDLGELLWAKAGFLESSGDLDGAIAIYEQLYAKNSANMIIANNLASLITTHRSDEESLARAELIARRLRGSSVPAYQDTFGWIAYRRGQTNEAEAELAKAAAGLPEDASVQYHYGMALLAQGKKPEAARQFARVTELAPAGDTRPFVEESRKTAELLAAEGVAPAE